MEYLDIRCKMLTSLFDIRLQTFTQFTPLVCQKAQKIVEKHTACSVFYMVF